jgi:hypothetical protein
MPQHTDAAGDWARNFRGQLVAAKDRKRVFKGATHTYYCVCSCGDTVTLRRGEEREAHFAYKAKAHRRNGCMGTEACKETEIHYNAKWLLCDIFQQINFWGVCGCNHRVREDQYTGPDWSATVEKQIPGTKRIADVLLENSSTGKAVALEVYHTHEVDEDKQNECELAGVAIIEVKAIYITPDCHDLHNRLNKYEWGECGECVEEDRIRQERFKAYCARREKEEHDRREREESEREQLRKHNIAMELQNAAREADAKREELKRREEFEEIEEIVRRATEENRRRERVQQELQREERMEQERVRQETRARERKERMEQERVRQETRAREREAENNRLYQREDDERNARRTFLRNAGVWCPSAEVLRAEDTQTALSRSQKTY